MNPIFFKSPEDFRAWLQQNHDKETELLVGLFKVGSGKQVMNWSQSVDQALCFGWIDGVRRSIDEDCYCIRFTPRRKHSIWSNVNIKKVEALIEQGLMQPKGLELYEARREDKTGIYAFENATKGLPKELEKIFKANKKAWEFFMAQAPSYKKVMLNWIVSAKQESTRLKRLEKTIIESSMGSRVQ